MASFFKPGALVVALSLAGATAPTQAAFELPPIDRIVNYQPKLPLLVFTADGEEIAQFGSERRIYTPLAKTPAMMVNAVLAVEDWRFREHSGIDPKGMARAVLALVTGGMRQGASTITQQLVRTMLLTREFTAERKGKEILLSLKVEQALSKDRILEIYLNEIYLGRGAYGFSAAAQTYFGKPLDKLSIAETAMLAGLPQNPNYANPVNNLQRAKARQEIVLKRMLDVGVITAAQHAAAKAEVLKVQPAGRLQVPAAHVAEMARLAVVQRFGNEALNSGMKVFTSLRAADQQAAHAALRRGVLAYDRRGAWRGPEGQEDLPNGSGPDVERAAAQALKDYKDDEQLRLAIVLQASPKALTVQLAHGEQRLTLDGEALRWAQPGLSPKAKDELKIRRGSVLRLAAQGKGWAVSQWPEAQAALVAMDTATGRVRALVGGFDFTRQPFNHVTQGWRQPGSSFKPLLYSAALESRIMPGTVVDDLPYAAANGWSPKNSDGQFLGPMTMREALAKSRNIVSVRLLEQVGVPRARDWAARFGLDPAKQPDNLTLALGTGSVTPMQMASAYATLANGGWRVNPVVIERVTDASGKVLFEAAPAPAFTEASRLLPERNVYATTSLLNDVTRVGTAARAQAQLHRSDLYGKTGTTDDAVDAWFAGYQPSIAAVAWMGFDTPRSLGDHESGGGAALPIWIDYMAAALKNVPVQLPGPAPAGLVRGEGGDWLYAEWQQGGWVQRISAEQGVQLAPPPVPAEAASAPAESAGASAPAATPEVAAPSASATAAALKALGLPQRSSAP